MLFSIVAVPIYIPTDNVGKVPFLHTFSSIYCLRIFTILLTYLFWLHWVSVAVQAFSSRYEQGLLFAVVHGPLSAAACLSAEHGLWGAQASLAAADGF